MGHVVRVDTDALQEAAGRLEDVGGRLDLLASRVAALCAAGGGSGSPDVGASLAGVGRAVGAALADGGGALGGLGRRTAAAGAAYRALEEALTVGLAATRAGGTGHGSHGAGAG